MRYWKRSTFWGAFVFAYLVSACILSFLARLAGSELLLQEGALLVGISVHLLSLYLAWLYGRHRDRQIAPWLYPPTTKSQE